MLKKKFFCFDKKYPVFVKKFGSQIKFCGIQVLTQYMNGTLVETVDQWPGATELGYLIVE